MATLGTDQMRESRCVECYQALHDGCRDGDMTRLPPERLLWELTQLVSAYACSAREARVRPTLVLARVRAALDPIARAHVIPVDMLVQRASADYYGAYPH